MISRIVEYLSSWFYYYYTTNECFKHTDIELKNNQDEEKQDAISK